MTPKAPVSELEREVMNVVWSRGTATAADIQIALAAERPLKDSTIRTVLLRLEEKGYVQHNIDGRTFVYSCVEPPASIAARAVKQILDRFCHGSLESLLAGMVNDEMVDTAELREIVDRLARSQSAPQLTGNEKRKKR
jgi:predicted transcriptional regulator